MISSRKLWLLLKILKDKNHDLKEIITRPKNAISKQYKALFSFEGVEFEITEDGREQIAQLAVEKKNWCTRPKVNYGKATSRLYV